MKRRTAKQGRRGSAVVEAALVLSLTLLFLIGLAEYGRYFMTSQLLKYAADDGARYAAKHTSTTVIENVSYDNTATAVSNAVLQRMAGIALQGQTITVFRSDSLGNSTGTWTDAASGEFVTVQITGTFSFLVPTLLGLPASMTTTVKSVKRSEGN